MAAGGIGKPVGIRNGATVLPNEADDMALVKSRLERISIVEGGTGGNALWQFASDRNARIIELAAAIAAFQLVQIAKRQLNAKKPDGAVDPNGGTIKRLAELAGPDPIRASVVIHHAMQVQTDPGTGSSGVISIDPSSVQGSGPLRPVVVSSAQTTRMLVNVPGCDIKWFGVVIPKSVAANAGSALPCFFFTPKPGQAGIVPSDYDRFVGTNWEGLWERYTRKIGAQVAQSGANVIVVFPFYTDNQMFNMGSFRRDWEDVTEAVITAAIDRMDPFLLRDLFDVGPIMTASFSNGINAHQEFYTNCRGASGAAQMSVVLDGKHLNPWRPQKSVAYINTHSPRGLNPTGSEWFVGGRFRPAVTALTPELAFNDHNRCPLLTFHAFQTFAPRP